MTHLGASELLFAAWPWLLGRLLVLHGDVCAAAGNLRRILHSKPQAAQLILALWPCLFGLNALVAGNALYATAPLVYGWLHSGILGWLSARVLGGALFSVALWQVWALVWPMVHRVSAMRRAVRVLCGANALLATGFFLACPRSPWCEFYLIQVGISAWVLWRFCVSAKPKPEQPKSAPKQLKAAPKTSAY